MCTCLSIVILLSLPALRLLTPTVAAIITAELTTACMGIIPQWQIQTVEYVTQICTWIVSVLSILKTSIPTYRKRKIPSKSKVDRKISANILDPVTLKRRNQEITSKSEQHIVRLSIATVILVWLWQILSQRAAWLNHYLSFNQYIRDQYLW